MTRRYPTHEDEGRFERSLPLTISRSTREPARSYPVASHATAVSLSRESENKTENTRRRIAVACQRCRKRKIRCSGDTGDGQGCQNCKNAGSGPSSCQFLRVSSTSFDTIPTAEWPYSFSSAPSLPSSGSFLYGAGPGSISSLNSSSFTGIPRPRYSSPSYAYQQLPNNQDYCGPYALSSPNESLFDQPYNVQPHASQGYMTSSGLPPGSSNFGGHEQIRAWPANTHSCRAYTQTYDQELPSSRYTQSSMSFNSIADASVSNIDGAPLVPSMGALAISQNPSMLDGRVLPNPRAGSMGGSVDTRDLATFVGAISVSQEGRAAGSWTSDQITACSASQPSTGATSSSTTGSLTSSGSRKSSSSPQEVHEMSFGLVPITKEFENETSAARQRISSTDIAKPEFNSNNVNTAASTTDERLALSTRKMNSPMELVSCQAQQTGAYSYTTGSAPKQSPISGSEPTLLNGQPYQPFNRIRQPSSQQQQNPQSLNNSLIHEPGDMTAHSTPRTAITTLGNNM